MKTSSTRRFPQMPGPKVGCAALANDAMVPFGPELQHVNRTGVGGGARPRRLFAPPADNAGHCPRAAWSLVAARAAQPAAAAVRCAEHRCRRTNPVLPRRAQRVHFQLHDGNRAELVRAGERPASERASGLSAREFATCRWPSGSAAGTSSRGAWATGGEAGAPQVAQAVFPDLGKTSSK